MVANSIIPCNYEDIRTEIEIARPILLRPSAESRKYQNTEEDDPHKRILWK